MSEHTPDTEHLSPYAAVLAEMRRLRDADLAQAQHYRLRAAEREQERDRFADSAATYADRAAAWSDLIDVAVETDETERQAAS